MTSFRRSAVYAAVVLAVIAFGACESGPPSDPGALQAGDQVPAPFLANVPLNGVPNSSDDDITGFLPEFDWGDFWVCKDGVDTDFTGSTNPSEALQSGSPFSVQDQNCELVGRSNPDGPPIEASVTEVIPAGWQLDSILVWLGDESGGSFTTAFEKGYGPGFSSPVPGDATIAGTVFNNSTGKLGCVVIYYNSEIPTGGEGCTPGGWKNHYGQQQGNGRNVHYAADWWQHTVYATGDKFYEVFGQGDSTKEDIIMALALENPVGGTVGERTLLEALNTNGGGLNALLRHATAALLNASSSEVDYDLTVQQVLDDFWAAVNGGDIEGTHKKFEGFNEQGCPQ